MSQIDDPRTVDDAPGDGRRRGGGDGEASGEPVDLSRLPPPPIGGAPAPPADWSWSRVWASWQARVSSRATVVSSAMAGFTAGRRRKPGPPLRTRHEAHLATLPPPPVAADGPARPGEGRENPVPAPWVPGAVAIGEPMGDPAGAVPAPAGATAAPEPVAEPEPDLEPVPAGEHLPDLEPAAEPEPVSAPAAEPVDDAVSAEPAPREDPWVPGGVIAGPGVGGPGVGGPGVAHDGVIIVDDLVIEEPAAEPAGFWRTRHERRKEWRRVERARRHAARHSVRFPIFTRSILLWMLVFALMGTAAGGTAAVFWSHFNTQLAELREENRDFDKRSQAAEARIGDLRDQAVEEIEGRMKELAPALAEPRTVQAGKIISPYVWFVTTLDDQGAASVGTAFSVVTDAQATWLVTSHNVVKAATVRPAPAIKLRKDAEEISAELVSWDAGNDLALLRIDRGNQPVLEWAPDDVQAKLIGTRLYVVSGFGGMGATLNSAMTIDQSSRGIVHDGRIGTAAQGGPIVTTDGKVVGVGSLVYQPLGFDPGELHHAASIRRVCDVLLTCTTQARRVPPTR